MHVRSKDLRYFQKFIIISEIILWKDLKGKRWDDLLMPSRVFNSYSDKEKRECIKKLLRVQHGKCLFCDRAITYTDNTSLDDFFKEYEVDHIIPLTEEGARDDDSNWAILHKECNRKKGGKPLFLAKRIYKFKRDKEKYGQKLTLGKVLEIHGIKSKPLFLKRLGEYAIVKYYENAIEREIKTPILKDPAGSPFDSIFISLPIEYIYHDADLNPRPIDENVVKLIEEFYENKHPQLHVCLARIEKIGKENEWEQVKVLLFDGQHKAVAQIYNERRKLLLRVFINGSKQDLKETNWRAHTDLRQIEFFRSIAARVGSGLFADKFKEYLNSPGKPKSESLFVKSLPYPEREQIKKEFLSWLKHGILHPKDFDPDSEDNLMTPYIEEEKSRKRNKPISYDAFEKTFIKFFVYRKPATEEIDPDSEEYFRIIERRNVVKLMSLIAQKVLINKFDINLGAYKLEERLRKGERIPELHLKAYRIFRPKTFEVWCEVLRDGIVQLLKLRGELSDTYAKEGKIFWRELNDETWEEIDKMLDRIFNHKIWLSDNPQIIEAINSTRKEICQKLLTEGKIDDTQVIDNPINFRYIVGVPASY